MVKALHAESETKSGSGCVLSDLAYFFLKIFSTSFSTFSYSQKVRLGFIEKGLGVGIGSVYLIKIQL